MWFVLGVVVLAPVAWALAGLPHFALLTDQAGELLATLGLELGTPPGWLTTAHSVEPLWIILTLLTGVTLGAGRAKRATTHISTLAHEFGHGLAVALSGGSIDRITLARDGSGLTFHRIPNGRPIRSFSISFAGYIAPSIVGLASLRAVLAGHGAAWLGFVAAVLVLMTLLTVRSWWGLLVCVVLGLMLGGLIALGSPSLISLAVVLAAGALLGGGIMDARAQYRSLGYDRNSDAWSMSRQTGIPAKFFAGLHVLLALLAAIGAAAIATLAVG